MIEKTGSTLFLTSIAIGITVFVALVTESHDEIVVLLALGWGAGMFYSGVVEKGLCPWIGLGLAYLVLVGLLPELGMTVGLVPLGAVIGWTFGKIVKSVWVFVDNLGQNE